MISRVLLHTEIYIFIKYIYFRVLKWVENCLLDQTFNKVQQRRLKDHSLRVVDKN